MVVRMLLQIMQNEIMNEISLFVAEEFPVIVLKRLCWNE